MQQTDKPLAVIYDLDGTLANLNGRLPYGDAQAECENDLVRQEVYDMLKEDFYDYEVFVVSGRFDTYEEQTRRWLWKHDIPYDWLFMRKEGDQRPDTVIKQEIYDNLINPHFEVVKVVDDRPKVIRMWQSLGLAVVDVSDPAKGDF
jgi:hypothetical protein